MPKRNIHFIWRQRGQNEEDEIIRKQNSFQKEKPYTTLEFRIPQDRWEWENNTSDFFERYPDKENDHQLHPLRKQYLENRLKDIDYQEDMIINSVEGLYDIENTIYCTCMNIMNRNQ